MTSVSSTITSINNDTAVKTAAQSASSTSQITGDTFLQLMIQQLQNQDPMNPTDTSQLLTQEAQFTTLSKTEEMTNNLESGNSVMQALSMVGATATVKDSSVQSGYTSGVVSAAELNGSSSAIIIDGKSYPVSNVVGVEPTKVSSTTTSSS